MVKKPIPPPLYLTQAKIEKEKLEVLKRTDRRIAEIGAVAEAQIPQSSRLFTLAFPVLVLLLYTAFTFSTKCQCTCTIYYLIFNTSFVNGSNCDSTVFNTGNSTILNKLNYAWPGLHINY
jgi:hypothetical protein